MAREHRTLRHRLGSVRVRTTGAAVLVVGISLIIGATILVSMLRQQLTDQIQTSARLRAHDVASALASGTSPHDLAVSNDEEQLIQVIDARRKVIASSENIAGAAPVADLDPGDSTKIGDVPVGDSATGFIVVAVSAKVNGSHDLVLVGRSTELASGSISFLTLLLAGGIPILLLIVGLTVWWLTGRALSPVEAMRAEVEEISGSELHRRVPDPRGSDEIARLASTMNRMLDRLEHSATTRRRFIADASHELRSPVASIRQHAEVAIAHPERITTTDLAETVLAEDLRVQRLVEDMLLLARTGQSDLQQNWHEVDLDDLVLDEAKRVRATSNLCVDLAGVSAGRVLGNEAQLHRVVRNLVDNAVRHASSSIVLALHADGTAVVFEVGNDGPGIPESDRERIFERFVRLDDARARDDGGSGLGLAIVHDIVAAHGGSVSVSQLDGGGPTFTVVFPVAASVPVPATP